MVDVSVYKQSNFAISTAKVKKRLLEVLKREGIVSDFSVSIAFVGEQKMEELVDKYYKDDPEKQYIHPILTFPNQEIVGDFIEPKGQMPDLGEIIISYPEAVATSKERGKLIDEVVMALVEHGAMHLLGNHHE